MSERRHAVADILEQLSDEELRRRIIVHGGPNLPVTEQTRGRLLEVLREYIEKSQPNHNSRSEENATSVATNACKSIARGSLNFGAQSSPKPSTSRAVSRDVAQYETSDVERFRHQMMVYSSVTFMISFVVCYLLNKLM